MNANISSQYPVALEVVRHRLVNEFSHAADQDREQYSQYYTDSDYEYMRCLPYSFAATMTDNEVCDWMASIDDGASVLVSQDMRRFELHGLDR